jgi:hypothetical protein
MLNPQQLRHRLLHLLRIRALLMLPLPLPLLHRLLQSKLLPLLKLKHRNKPPSKHRNKPLRRPLLKLKHRLKLLHKRKHRPTRNTHKLLLPSKPQTNKLLRRLLPLKLLLLRPQRNNRLKKQAKPHNN